MKAANCKIKKKVKDCSAKTVHCWNLWYARSISFQIAALNAQSSHLTVPWTKPVRKDKTTEKLTEEDTQSKHWYPVM